MSTIWVFENIEKKHTLYRGEDCMTKSCTSLRQHATNIINLEKKNMSPLTKEELKTNQYGKVCYVCGKRFPKWFAHDKSYQKLRGHCRYTGKCKAAAHTICSKIQ